MGKPQNLKDALKSELTEDELKLLVRSYDIVGDIAIMDIPEELVPKESIIAKQLLDSHRNVNVVCKKVGIHSGEFRTQAVEIIAGEDRKETLYKENGGMFYLNVETCYFSSRSGNERKRIAGLVKDGESVLVMFCGIGPFVVVIAKNSKPGKMVGIEKNPEAAEYANRNVIKNKVKNTKIICGDVNEVVPELDEKFDRIAMPLPKTAEEFLDTALNAIKPNGVVHFYDFQHVDEFDLAVEKIRNSCERTGRKLKSAEVIVCGQYAPRTHRITVDAIIE